MTGVASVLAIFAHPDDESLAAGGALALSAARGHRVSLLCLTRGEGRSLVPAEAADVAQIRARELAEAACCLGITTVRLEAFRDGYLPWEDGGLVRSRIRAMIDAVQAAVVVTFDEDGLYWHPDHIAVYQHVMAAVADMGATAPAVYGVTMPPGRMRELAAGMPVLGIEADAFGAEAPAPTWRLNVAAVLDIKVKALRQHRSQVTDDPLDSASSAQMMAALATEQYRLVYPGAGGIDWQQSLEEQHD